MKHFVHHSLGLAGLVWAALGGAARAGDEATVHWPMFRGPAASGVAQGVPTPTTWNVETGHNVKWTKDLPGLGHGAPVIWGDKLFLMTAISSEGDQSLRVGLYGDIVPLNEPVIHRWVLYCLDKNDGRVLWEREVHQGVPSVKRHAKASHANSTPATDGEHVVAFFGSEGICCYDAEGKQLWKKEMGPLDAGFYMLPMAQWGFGSSPLLHAGAVIIQCDIQKDPFLAALDVETGKELWRTPRDDVPTWSTPAIASTPDKGDQIIVNGYKHIGGYDFKTGKETWRMRGGGDIPVPTPLVHEDRVYVANAHGRLAPVYAIKTSAAGDVSLKEDEWSNENVVWCDPRCGSYMQTPIVYGPHLYCCRDNGVLTCYDARTGEVRYRARLGGGSSGFTASPAACGGRLYYTSEQGDVIVVQAGNEFKVLAENTLGDVCMATPAVSEGTLFFRARNRLIAIGETGAPPARPEESLNAKPDP